MNVESNAVGSGVVDRSRANDSFTTALTMSPRNAERRIASFDLVTPIWDGSSVVKTSKPSASQTRTRTTR